MKRNVLAVTLILSLILPLPTAGIASAEPNDAGIEQKKEAIRARDKQILQLEKKKKRTEQEQQDALANIEALKSKLQAYDKKVYELEQKAEQGERKIKGIEQQIEQRREIFNQRLRSIYLQGKMFYLETLLQSSSFADFLGRLDYIYMLNRADNHVIEGYQNDRKRLLAAQQELESDLALQKQEKAKADQLYRKLEAQLKQHESALASLDADLSELEEENEKARREVAALVATAAREAREREIRDELSGKTIVAYTGGKFYWPVDGGVLTSPFGKRYHPISHTYRMHEGIDIAAGLGTPIKAAAPGEVIESRPSDGYGYIVVIYHGDGLSTLYAHMYAQTVKVKKGQKVERGQVIAAVGNNGRSTGPHLHFEVHKSGTPVDPMSYFR
ncbi:murein hydrolase activator EnvC family protein [Lihuaxuella thermophila]|uniref:Septal ring factor EnvC, activator of murein hydrolases AmiA and AmiB n=1 Tax=Lihuaxuella thermophila TaxID=1173111 RepID=A0A1H8GTL1_9BACL|nr:peptidoglycan DD-metalloendopeptidase family protein [Lihuaxuella thermophila]SEN46827.1 Septal ring factor EnvC, activator of murein hydrolases AmiA and AmiB [Lihuaxuella thermophila]